MKADAATILVPADEVARRVEDAARRLRPLVNDESILVCLLTGGLWFAADLTRALSRLGCHPLFDAVWLASYGDERESGGRVEVRAPMQRPVSGRRVILVDEVMDSGLSLREAARLMREAGASAVHACIFARKPRPRHPGRSPGCRGLGGALPFSRGLRDGSRRPLARPAGHRGPGLRAVHRAGAGRTTASRRQARAPASRHRSGGDGPRRSGRRAPAPRVRADGCCTRST